MAEWPIGRFSPSAGLTIDRTGSSVAISGLMELSGPEATDVRARSVQSSINTTWTHTFKDGFEVSCDIVVRFRAVDATAGIATQIDAVKSLQPSHVGPALNGRSMTLNADESDAFTWTPAHEFGHIIGLQDRFTDLGQRTRMRVFLATMP